MFIGSGPPHRTRIALDNLDSCYHSLHRSDAISMPVGVSHVFRSVYVETGYPIPAGLWTRWKETGQN